MSYRYLLLFPLLLPATSLAAESEPSPWLTEIELGYQSLSGNSDSSAFNTRMAASYTKGRIKNTAESKYLLAEKDGKEDKRKFQLNAQSNYKYDEKRYVLASGSYVDDRYGPYFSDIVVATGLGYQAIRKRQLQLTLELGPGYRRQRPNLDELDSDDKILPYDVDEIIVRGQMNVEWRPRKNVTVDLTLTGIAGNSNSTIEADTSLTASISDTLAVKISNTQNYSTDVPPGLKNRDSVMTVNLLYKF